MTKLLTLFGFLLLRVACVYSQTGVEFELDSLTISTNDNLDSLTSKLKSGDLIIYNDKNKIPREVRAQLNLLTKDDFSIANKKEEYRCCCTSPRTLPKRQLQFLAIGKGYLAMTYLTGGFGESTHILLLTFNQSEITNLWAGISLGDIKTKKDLIKDLVAQRKNKYNLHWFL